MIGNKRKKINMRLGDIIGPFIKRLMCLPVELALNLLTVNKLSYVRIDEDRNVRSQKL